MTRQRVCRICKRPMGEAAAEGSAFPFCSKRCADIDLLRWLNAGYAIPAGDADEAASGEEEAKDDDASPRLPPRH